MRITHITSEYSPFAKAGGLGDVLHGLSKKQAEDGHEVTVILPKYDIIDTSIFDTCKKYMQDLWCYENGDEIHNRVYKATFEGVTLFLIDPDHTDYYFKRGVIYGTKFDREKFLYFSRAAVEFLKKEDKVIDILHLHDWPTAVAAPLIQHLFPEVHEKISSIIFNIHNIEHQGKVPSQMLTRIGLFGPSFLTRDSMMDPYSEKHINLMKGAILYANKIITVSPTYAKEIATREYGFGLDVTIKRCKEKLHGILNGIEVETWNPMEDKYLSENYPTNATFINDICRKKQANKKALCEELNLNISSPLIICVTRIATQKGPELILHAIEKALELGGSFILLGNICEEPLEEKFLAIQKKYASNKRLHISFTFDEELSHKLFAAADAIFIPSKFEPCGLTQLISMRYGTIPIARSTGGLKDTITNIDHPHATGFTFEKKTTDAVDEILEKAFNLYNNHPHLWQKLIQNGMNRDTSWKFPAKLYEKVYQESLSKKNLTKS